MILHIHKDRLINLNYEMSKREGLIGDKIHWKFKKKVFIPILTMGDCYEIHITFIKSKDIYNTLKCALKIDPSKTLEELVVDYVNHNRLEEWFSK